MNPKLAKYATKGALTVCVATVIGFLIKAEDRIDDKIDARYASKDAESKIDQ